MARLSFGAGSADYVADLATGRPESGIVVTLWTASTGGTQVTDLRAADGTTVISSLTSGPGGQLPLFYGPDGVSVLWAQAPGGPARTLMDTHDALTTATGRAAALALALGG